MVQINQLFTKKITLPWALSGIVASMTTFKFIIIVRALQKNRIQSTTFQLKLHKINFAGEKVVDT